MGVADGVAHRLSNDRLGVLGQRRGQDVQGTRHPHGDAHRGIADQVVDDLLDPCPEPGRPRGTGVQVEDGCPNVLDDLVQLVDVLGQPVSHRGGLHAAVGALHGHADREQPLDDMVVQIPGDPIAVGQHVALPARRQRFGPLQRQRGLIGERRHHLKLALIEHRITAVAHHQQHPGDHLTGAHRHRQRRTEPGVKAADGVVRQAGNVARYPFAKYLAGGGPGYRDLPAHKGVDAASGAHGDGELADLRGILLRFLGHQ